MMNLIAQAPQPYDFIMISQHVSQKDEAVYTIDLSAEEDNEYKEIVDKISMLF